MAPAFLSMALFARICTMDRLSKGNLSKEKPGMYFLMDESLKG